MNCLIFNFMPVIGSLLGQTGSLRRSTKKVRCSQNMGFASCYSEVAPSVATASWRGSLMRSRGLLAQMTLKMICRLFRWGSELLNKAIQKHPVTIIT